MECLRRAAHARRPGLVPTPVSEIAAVAVTALAGRFAVAALVEDVISNSSVAFFSSETVLPRAAPGALVLALLAAGVAAVLTLDAVWTLLPPRGRLWPYRLASPSPPRSCCCSCPSAASRAWRGRSRSWPSPGARAPSREPHLVRGPVALRAAVVPLGASLALFPALQARTHEATIWARHRERRRRNCLQHLMRVWVCLVTLELRIKVLAWQGL